MVKSKIIYTRIVLYPPVTTLSHILFTNFFYDFNVCGRTLGYFTKINIVIMNA